MPSQASTQRKLGWEKDMAETSVDTPETVEVETARVSCDGGGGALGHPKVYLQLNDDGFVECGYCDRRFVLKPGTKLHAGH